jgi:hypothetical protein
MIQILKEETMLKSYNKTTAFMSAAMMTGLLSSESQAQDFETYTKGASDQVTAFPDIVAFICYLGGFVLAALGVVGLKQHVENPGNAPMKNGLAKLGFGGMLMALPPVVGAIQGSGAGAGAAGTALQQFGAAGIK